MQRTNYTHVCCEMRVIFCRFLTTDLFHPVTFTQKLAQRLGLLLTWKMFALIVASLFLFSSYEPCAGCTARYVCVLQDGRIISDISYTGSLRHPLAQRIQASLTVIHIQSCS